MLESNLLLAKAIDLLDLLVQVEGQGSDVCDVAEGVAALLRSLRPRASAQRPADLMFLAGAALHAAIDTGAASADCFIEVGNDAGGWSMQRTSHLADALKNAANSSALR